MLFHYSCISQQLPAVLWVVWKDPKDKDKNLFLKIILVVGHKTKQKTKKREANILTHFKTQHTHTHTQYLRTHL